MGDSRITPEVIWFENGNGIRFPAIIDENVDLNQLNPLFWGSTLDREQHIHFLLYTRGDTSPYELTVGNVDSLESSKFDKALPTKIVIHGFTNSDKVGLAPVARSAYINSKNSALPPVNLIVVDWGKNTFLVGVKVARFIEFLVAQGNSLNKIHCIGHSLGAHIAGFAGSNMTNMTLPRITALDPALPLFEDATDENRIDPSDAAYSYPYVDVIHTAGGGSSTNRNGRAALAFFEPRGHADFYVNNGKTQPGCGLDIFGACAHLRAYEYYFESVANPVGFLSCECNSWKEYDAGTCECSNVAFMGEHCSNSSRGMFYLKTRSRAPYAIYTPAKIKQAFHI
ncbi:Pancreatic triacylglycerol lipase [Orchesella cincta]|uniref:Pancreatic triacylglycerol lipase n=1 Tax=Orchesella cincta TaxID=48709 RepID=A0A1D2MNF3_ORCCI|nr:Pancreatic triacylglycerol lipase [Orchesella cincta]